MRNLIQNVIQYKAFTYCTLLLTTPSLFSYPEVTPPIQQTEYESPLTYDEILEILDDLESEELEKKYSPAQLEQLNEFIAGLAAEGILPDESDEEIMEDIDDLLQGDDSQFEIIPAIFHGNGYNDIIYCGWLSKKWKKTKNFVKKHKKAIIIGAVVVVAAAAITVAVVAASSSAAATAAGVGGAAASSATNKKKTDPPKDITKPDLDPQISSFKEHVAKEQFFEPPKNGEGLSIEETGRVLGPLFAHESFNYHLSHELLNNASPVDIGRREIDRGFSTDYAHLFTNQNKETNFHALSYQIMGEEALNRGYCKQAVEKFGKAIELNPANSIPYLGRSEAYFRSGNYDRCLEDFHTFAQQSIQESKTDSLSISEFSFGFAKGLPKGIYESGHGILILLYDIAIHPIHTSNQMWYSLKILNDLARSKEWTSLAEVLAPEVYQLITQWDSLSSNVKGELAGYAFGKYGADILIPGALAKTVSKRMKGAQELNAISRSLKTTERTFLMESVSGLGDGAKIAEVVQLEKTITEWLGKEARYVRNKAGDAIFLSKDGLRRIRFDFKNPYPHTNPHSHIEINVNGTWMKSGPIYPIDVPSK